VRHVVAGSRTYNIYFPYQDEFNRHGVNIISTYNFAPTQLAADEELGDCDKIHYLYVYFGILLIFPSMRKEIFGVTKKLVPNRLAGKCEDDLKCC